MAMISRRGFLGSSAAVAAGAAVWPRGLFAQQVEVPALVATARATAAKAKISTTKLRGNVYALQGSGGNIALLTGKDGRVVVDSGYSTSKPQLLEAMDAISADPMTHLINTHWHFDHTDGNEWMHAAGATIVAHDNTKTRLSTVQTIAAFQATFPPSPAGAIPTMTFAEQRSMTLNGVVLAMEHYKPAHTDTDISIRFVGPNVLHTGDTWFNGAYPFIDYSTGGSINGMIQATQHNVSQVEADTIVIPGHGAIGDRKQLQETLEMLTTIRDRVAALKKQGMTLDEVVAAKPSAQFDAKWGPNPAQSAHFTGYVYQGV